MGFFVIKKKDGTNTRLPEHRFRTEDAPTDGGKTKYNLAMSGVKPRRVPCRSQKRVNTKRTAGRGDLGDNRVSKSTHGS